MTGEEFEAAREAIEELRQETRKDLAADLGGEPEDYRADKRPVSDGGKD